VTDPAHRTGRRDLVAVLGTLVLIALILMLPDLAPPSDAAAQLEAEHGRIVELLPPPEPTSPDAEPVFEPDAVVEIIDGPRKGDYLGAYLQGPSGQLDLPDYLVGDEVVVTITEQPDGPDFVAVADRWRLPFLIALGAIFIGFVILVGLGRGLRALIALALTMVLVLKVVVPVLLQGAPPVPVALLAAGGITLVTILLTEGINRPAMAAILGTLGALALTGLLSVVAIDLAGFTNAAGTDLVYLTTTGGESLDLRGLLLASFLLGALGVLDDVTVTQAAAVEELSHTSGRTGSALVGSGMRVGRSHIAATVNTLFLAYVGASLPLIVLFAVSEQPVAYVINEEIVAVEIVRTLVGSLGILAAVPFTTVVAAWLIGRRRRPTGAIGS
jgi:uncharacterized membrane protein